jgi:hypothetical protein
MSMIEPIQWFFKPDSVFATEISPRRMDNHTIFAQKRLKTGVIHRSRRIYRWG